MNFTGSLAANQLVIDFGADQGQASLITKGSLPASTTAVSTTVNLLWQADHVVAISQQKMAVAAGETGLILTLPWAITADYLLPFLKQTLMGTVAVPPIPANLQTELVHYWQPFQQLLGFLNQTALPVAQPDAPAKAKETVAKASHRWRSEVSKIDFQINYRGSQATVRWTSRNQMIIAAGATLLAEAPLNKDGSLGFSARFASQLRQEHQAAISHFTTTAPITLKSVNEVGLFLYFGGTNSWLVLQDQQGKTIDAWTVVKK